MQSATKRLENLIDNEKTGYLSFSNYSLNDIKKILKIYGNPHKKIKSIHIAGTNGKGSTAYMLNSILIECGYNTGLYISPHLLRVNERIKINNWEITDKKLNTYTDELTELLRKNPGLRPTYFDALTLFAFRYFADEKMDVAVIEVGLGGRLDSTNVISPLISIITDISIDHKNVLGKKIKEIASEKAGIIKRGVPVITSNTGKQVIDVIGEEAIKKSSKLYILNRDFRITNVRYSEERHKKTFDILLPQDIQSGKGPVENIILKLPGEFQIKNAALAVTASMLLKTRGFNINGKIIKKAIGNMKIPGRMHIINRDPLIIFDPAHNLHAMKTTIRSLTERYPDKKNKVIASFMTDKNCNAMFKIIKEQLTDDLYYYELDDERCLKISGQGDAGKKNLYPGIKTFNNLKDLARAISRDIREDTLIFITGTFRLFAPARKLSSIIKNLSKFP